MTFPGFWSGWPLPGFSSVSESFLEWHFFPSYIIKTCKSFFMCGQSRFLSPNGIYVVFFTPFKIRFNFIICLVGLFGEPAPDVPISLFPYIWILQFPSCPLSPWFLAFYPSSWNLSSFIFLLSCLIAKAFNVMCFPLRTDLATAHKFLYIVLELSLFPK